MKRTTRLAMEALLRRKREILRLRDTQLDEAEETRAGNEPDWTDLASDETLEVDLGRLTDLELRELREIAAALARIDAGTYGFCEECGGAIEPDRLQVLPTARECFVCAEIGEDRRRPLRR